MELEHERHFGGEAGDLSGVACRDAPRGGEGRGGPPRALHIGREPALYAKRKEQLEKATAEGKEIARARVH